MTKGRDTIAGRRDMLVTNIFRVVQSLFFISLARLWQGEGRWKWKWNAERSTEDLLTLAALGGTAFPELEIVHPLGRPEMLVVAPVALVAKVVLATHGHPLGVVTLEDPAFHPELVPNGSGSEFVEVTAGALLEATELAALPALPLTVPPEALIDSHVPAVPSYE